MELKSERLILRTYTPEDWESVHDYAKDPEFSKYEPWGPNTVIDTKKFISENIESSLNHPRYHFELAVCLKHGGSQIGGCGLRKESQDSVVANMGWAMNPSYQNRGYTSEAAKTLLNFGWGALGLQVVYATCDTRNAASRRVMEKIGMKKVGHGIGDRHFKGEIADSYRYEITNPLAKQ